MDRTLSDQARIIKELEAELEVLQREAKGEEQTGIFGVKAEMVQTESNKTRAMEFKAQVFETGGPERDRSAGRTCSRPILLKWRRGSGEMILRGNITCGLWGRSYRR